jgi:transposase InsO family protein
MAGRHPRWGYRKIHHLLTRQGWQINKKRVRRLWREESLQVKRRRKRRRTGRRSPRNITAARPNHIWAMDFEFDQSRKGRQLKILNMTDEFTHEGIAGEVDYRVDAHAVCRVLDQTVKERGGAPDYIRCDNGPELIARRCPEFC